MGVDKFRIYAGLLGLDLTAAGVTAEQCIDAFRGSYPRIAGTYAGTIEGRPYRKGGVWTQLEQAAMSAVRDGGEYEAGRCVFRVSGGALVCELPSGRELRYHGAEIADREPAYARGAGRMKATLVYRHPRGWEKSLYGGLLAENVCQAIARDFLAGALVALRAAGLPVVLHVHDEAVVEAPAPDAPDALRRAAEIMSAPPAWAPDVPLAVAGYTSDRYRKEPETLPAGDVKVHALRGAVK